MGHLCLSQGEESSPSPSMDRLPRHSDPKILTSMSALGYNPCEIHKSVLNRIFNEAMTIYFMVRQPTHQGVSCTVYIMWHKVLYPRNDPSYLSTEL
jgi:hypothetical protein